MAKYIMANGALFIDTPKMGRIFSHDLTEELVSRIKDKAPHLMSQIEEIEEVKQSVKAIAQDVKK